MNPTHYESISVTWANQKMKFGQLIEHNMRIIILKNNTQNIVKKLFPHRN